MNKYCEMLMKENGLRYGEQFDIINKQGDVFRNVHYRFTDIINDYIESMPVVLGKLILGIYTIKRIPFEPQVGEKYWFISLTIGRGIEAYINNNDKVDKRIFKSLKIFRTKDEAIAERDSQEWWEGENEL